jgi:DNA-directed RNA polymerase subunit K/omega
MLTAGAKKLTTYSSAKDVTVAVHEIEEGKISYHRINKTPSTHEHLVEAQTETNVE